MDCDRHQIYVPNEYHVVLFDGTKNFAKDGHVVDVLIVYHTNHRCIELICYNAMISRQAPRVYINFYQLRQKIDDQEIKERLENTREIASRDLKEIDIYDARKAIFYEMIIEYILVRLTVSNDHGFIGFFQVALLPHLQDQVVEGSNPPRLDIICEKPAGLKALEVCYTTNAKKEDILLAQHRLHERQQEDQEINRIARLANSAVSCFKWILARRRQLERRLKPRRFLARLRWVKAIRRVLQRNIVERMKKRVITSNVSSWYMESVNHTMSLAVQAMKVRKLEADKEMNHQRLDLKQHQLGLHQKNVASQQSMEDQQQKTRAITKSAICGATTGVGPSNNNSSNSTNRHTIGATTSSSSGHTALHSRGGGRGNASSSNIAAHADDGSGGGNSSGNSRFNNTAAVAGSASVSRKTMSHSSSSATSTHNGSSNNKSADSVSDTTTTNTSNPAVTTSSNNNSHNNNVATTAAAVTSPPPPRRRTRSMSRSLDQHHAIAAATAVTAASNTTTTMSSSVTPSINYHIRAPNMSAGIGSSSSSSSKLHHHPHRHSTTATTSHHHHTSYLDRRASNNISYLTPIITEDGYHEKSTTISITTSLDSYDNNSSSMLPNAPGTIVLTPTNFRRKSNGEIVLLPRIANTSNSTHSSPTSAAATASSNNAAANQYPLTKKPTIRRNSLMLAEQQATTDSTTTAAAAEVKSTTTVIPTFDNNNVCRSASTDSAMSDTSLESVGYSNHYYRRTQLQPHQKIPDLMDASAEEEEEGGADTDFEDCDFLKSDKRSAGIAIVMKPNATWMTSDESSKIQANSPLRFLPPCNNNTDGSSSSSSRKHHHRLHHQQHSDPDWKEKHKASTQNVCKYLLRYNFNPSPGIAMTTVPTVTSSIGATTAVTTTTATAGIILTSVSNDSEDDFFRQENQKPRVLIAAPFSPLPTTNASSNNNSCNHSANSSPSVSRKSPNIHLPDSISGATNTTSPSSITASTSSSSTAYPPISSLSYHNSSNTSISSPTTSLFRPHTATVSHSVSSPSSRGYPPHQRGIASTPTAIFNRTTTNSISSSNNNHQYGHGNSIVEDKDFDDDNNSIMSSSSSFLSGSGKPPSLMQSYTNNVVRLDQNLPMFGALYTAAK